MNAVFPARQKNAGRYVELDPQHFLIFMRTRHINRAAGRIRYRREIYYSIFFAVFQGGTKTKLHNFYRFSELILDAEFNLYIS